MPGRRLRVALVTDTYAPAVNGVVRSVQTSKRELERLGAEVRVFAPGTRSVRRAHAEPGVGFLPSVETSIYPNLHVSVWPLLPRQLRGFDVVHAHTPGPLGLAAILSARRLGIPALYTYHTRFDDLLHYLARTATAERLLARASDRIDRLLASRCSSIIAPTDAIADELEAFHGWRPDVVPTGVDLDMFRPAPRWDGQPPTFLHIGRVSKEKNLEAVLRAFPMVREALPDARLLVGGSGPDLDRMRRLAADLGLGAHVLFLGFVPEEDLASTYARADVLVTASKFETQGLTVVEAMACGAPAAVADVPVFRPLVESGAALPFNADSSADVARGMIEAYERRVELARRAQQTARECSTRAVARKLYTLYARVAAEAAAPRRELTA